jgi:hypothetical protein
MGVRRSQWLWIGAGGVGLSLAAAVLLWDTLAVNSGTVKAAEELVDGAQGAARSGAAVYRTLRNLGDRNPR